MLHAAAVVPTPPLLVPEISGASAGREADLRAACDDAVAALLVDRPDRVLVVGGAPGAPAATASWDWRGFGVVQPVPAPRHPLPLALAIGAWLLDRHGWRGERGLVAVPPDLAPSDCASTGAASVAGDARTALLVCGDGSARRSRSAPGHLHPDAEAWDAEVARALATADCGALAALSPARAVELMASGRAPWQVLAGAAVGRSWQSGLTFSAAPHGVAYHVATWLPVDGASSPGPRTRNTRSLAPEPSRPRFVGACGTTLARGRSSST
jgi:hypothetical protein